MLLFVAALSWAVSGGPTWAAGEGEEACFTSSMNGERSGAGRAQLTTRADLVDVARRHSARMANSNQIYHNQDLQNEAPPDWNSIGENVGRGPTCGEIHVAFMNSPAHRKNILDPEFSLVGVGVVIRGETIFVTEVFMQPAAPAPPPPPASPTAPSASPDQSPAQPSVAVTGAEPGVTASPGASAPTGTVTESARGSTADEGGSGVLVLIAVGVGAALLLAVVWFRGHRREAQAEADVAAADEGAEGPRDQV